jgi:hypothetical protein
MLLISSARAEDTLRNVPRSALRNAAHSSTAVRNELGARILGIWTCPLASSIPTRPVKQKYHSARHCTPTAFAKESVMPITKFCPYYCSNIATALGPNAMSFENFAQVRQEHFRHARPKSLRDFSQTKSGNPRSGFWPHQDCYSDQTV